ncbi:FHA domain-containing protein [Anaeromyxobacter oryzisoli]|uniref:FHA domain-containing protein n=1 Tax=Anaeromyxobacter oryzisoli TaxID=2925408 RepID=UPI001F568796|nr:FHA domain-containing protein [Anaeromyxobacter sp. SG63]
MKTVRPIAIADHLWEALDRMALEMGSDREALVNQALHVFARLNGYLVPGSIAAAPPRPPAEPPSAERLAVAEQVLEAAERLERAIHDRPQPPVAAAPAARAAAAPAAAPPHVLARDDGTEVVVAKDRFVIGRGRHCDLVVEGGKISREHAAVVRQGGEWWIEDLGSANGTWHQRARVQRRRIADGDEYFICSERLRCALR